MNKIDITSWKKFKVKDLFLITKGSGGIIKNSLKGTYPLISSTKSNNGISNLIEENDEFLSNKNVLTVASNGSVGETFYQDEVFYSTADVNILKPKFKMNKYIALFITTIINKEKYKYCYGRKFTKEKMEEKTIIKLPTTQQGELDFEYMENYIKNLENKIHFKKIYTKNKKTNTKLDVKNWKFFKLFDKKNSNNSLFRVELSKGDLKQKNCLNGDIPLISASKYNNGVVKYVDDGGDGKANIFSSNTITADMFCNIFYQDKNFYSVAHGRVNILIPNFNMNKYIALFITTILKCEKYKFPYGRNLYKEETQNIKIKLPTTKDDKPDFEYMENYIKALPYGDLI